MNRDRGQLLLVAGLGLALAFVVLALVLNAVVFTENLATRNHGETDDVVGHERAVEAGVGGLLVEANTYDDANATTVRAALEAGVGRWDANASLLTASSGTITAASVQSVENGTRIAQPTARNFSNDSGADDWTAAVDVNETRRFEAVVTPASGDPLTFEVSDGSASWRVAVIDEGSATNVSAFRNGSLVATHTRTAETVALDVTEGTVNGTRVANWTFAENVSAPYDVSVENGGNASGRYGFVVDVPDAEADVPSGTYASRGSGSPTAVPALYGATVDVTVRDDRVTYQTNVSVAPESSPSPAPWASPD
ncbi:uncharacterized protein HHUB_1920 [Halobacterium hubeiense]|uniref:Uncharacterized protein n=1 Tax=Halobacterium hubeiense TaxID=1407499 RepID=A0A0U5H3X8_9EURY|nr:hypothetical protein [Halobacterium hubeiense]CQH53066.1 uncharacterized protein HHUB_1920 [Halobacterium hubeiense]